MKRQQPPTLQEFGKFLGEGKFNIIENYDSSDPVTSYYFKKFAEQQYQSPNAEYRKFWKDMFKDRNFVDNIANRRGIINNYSDELENFVQGEFKNQYLQYQKSNKFNPYQELKKQTPLADIQPQENITAPPVESETPNQNLTQEEIQPQENIEPPTEIQPAENFESRNTTNKKTGVETFESALKTNLPQEVFSAVKKIAKNYGATLSQSKKAAPPLKMTPIIILKIQDELFLKAEKILTNLKSKKR